jgi:tRNA-2-methylthio-N6-dimethylallyladenosine synthase
VLTGCAVREAERAALGGRYPAVDLFLRPDEEPELVERLGLASATAPGLLAGRSTAALARVGRTTVGSADHLAAARAGAVVAGTVRREKPWRAWVPVIYGCDKTCTYCIVPFSRGPERSRPFDDVVAECRTLGDAGVSEVTLLGQNVNSYGHDLPPEPRFAGVEAVRPLGRRIDAAGRPDFAALLRAVDGLRRGDGRPAIPRLRFVTSHPWDLTDRLIEAMAECRSVCEHLHLPVQSGSDAVLRRMGRQYTVEGYLRLVEKLRVAVPGIALSTDVIIGFCGETEADHRATLGLLETVGFDQVFAAAYSVRPGTPAARLADDVPAAEKRRRLNELLALQEGIGWQRNRAWVGRVAEVLLDSTSATIGHEHDPHAEGDAQGGPRGPRVSGRTRESKLVHLDGPAEWVGRLVDVRIEQAGPYSLQGTALPT